MTHECGNKVYIGDKYCSECGMNIVKNNKTIQINEFNPDIFKFLTTEFPDIKIFTGFVTETLNYNRSTWSPNSTADYSYIFITLEDKNGNFKKINLRAENPIFSSINVGDVITVCQPTNSILTDKIKYSIDRKKVTAHDLSTITVLYKGGEASCYIDDCLSPPPFSSFFSIFTFLLLTISIWLGCGKNVYSATAGLTIGLIVGYFLRKRTVKNYEETQKKYQKILDLGSELKTIRLHDLGFENSTRIKNDSDILCPKCMSRIKISDKFCSGCGYSIEKSSDLSRDIQCHSKSIREQRIELLSECNETRNFEFSLKRLIIPNLKVKGHSIVKLCRVVDRNISSDVRSWTEEHITETEYRYRTGEYSHTDTKKSYTHHRTSKVTGTLFVEDSTGKATEIEFPAAILRVSDVGDYILFGYTYLENNQYAMHSSMEFCININKETSSEDKKLTDVSTDSGYIFKIFIAVGLTINLSTIFFDLGELFMLSAIGVSFSLMLLVLVVNFFRNMKILNKHSKPIWDFRNKILEKTEELTKRIESLK